MASPVKREMKFALILIAAVMMLIVVNPYFFGPDSVYSMSSQENDDDNGRMNATTECIGFGTESRSAAENTQLNENNANITQRCDQVISSANDKGSNNINYAKNTVQGNDGDNQVSQGSKQKIGD